MNLSLRQGSFFAFSDCLPLLEPLSFGFTMAPKAKDPASAHADVIEGLMYCKYCHKKISGEGIFRLKQHLAGIKGDIIACDAPLDVIGHIREEMLKVADTS